ncbi:unnamed protein product, partial [Phaeothamnion confervicola]
MGDSSDSPGFPTAPPPSSLPPPPPELQRDAGKPAAPAVPEKDAGKCVAEYERRTRMLRIAVEGCCHGELDNIYASIGRLEVINGVKVDLLICCGDFEALRNEGDLAAMAVPDKYKVMGTFHKYYSGEMAAPIPTLFIGGNHEASNYLQELYLGGWAAPNIYFLGWAGVVTFGGVRIAGLSGIYASRDYRQGHHERPPYTASTMRSVYHVREFEVAQLSQLTGRVDVCLSHDWPRGIVRFGNKEGLLRRKSFFRAEARGGVESNTLGSPPAESLLHKLRPTYWFAAHLHCKFAAVVPHTGSGAPPGAGSNNGSASKSGSDGGGDGQAEVTRFLSLDKCLPNRDFLQLVEIVRPASEPDGPPRFAYDPEWLAIVRATHALLPTRPGAAHAPQAARGIAEGAAWVREQLAARGLPAGPIAVPENFVATVLPYEPPSPGAWLGGRGRGPRSASGGAGGGMVGNPQTDTLLALLGLEHRVTVPAGAAAGRSSADGGANG